MLFSLSACFEIKEEIEIASGGNGKYKLVLDMKQSKEQIAIALKNEQGIQNPFAKMDSSFALAEKRLSEIKGITDVKTISDQANFVFGISFTFDDIQVLNQALNDVDQNGSPQEVYHFYKQTLERLPVFYLKRVIDLTNVEESEKAKIQVILQNASYSHLIRTSGKIKSYLNKGAQLGSSKRELYLQTRLKEVLEGKTPIAETVKFKGD